MRGVILLLLAALAVGCVTEASRVPIAAESVRIYTEPPAEFELIGILDIMVPGERDHAMEILRAKAGEWGANGVLIAEDGDSSGSGRSDTTTVARARVRIESDSSSSGGGRSYTLHVGDGADKNVQRLRAQAIYVTTVTK